MAERFDERDYENNDLQMQIQKDMEEKDASVNGFSLPIRIRSAEDYRETLAEKISEFKRYLQKSAYYRKDMQFLNEIRKKCDLIIEAINKYLSGDICGAVNSVTDYLNTFMEENSFFVTTLDRSYAFRQIAPFKELQVNGEKIYEKMLETPLTFYRVRTENVSEVNDMLHIPLNRRGKICTQRYSIPGIPCLYLGTTTYVCWLETGKVSNHSLYASCFVPNEQGKNLKILNMVLGQGLINGIYNPNLDGNNMGRERLQKDILLMWPMLCATSFAVEEGERVFRVEYVVSQLVMYAMQKLGIDGVAYLSTKGDSDLQIPHGVNVAFPIFEEHKGEKYGDICKCFKIGKPINLESFCNITLVDNMNQKRSYINTVYKEKDMNGNDEFMSKVVYNGEYIYYGKLIYSRFDDYLLNRI